MPQVAAAALRASWRPPRVVRRYCALARLDALLADIEQGEAGPNWLSQREQSELAAWRDESRRRGWLLGRVLGKQLIAGAAATGIKGIEILSRDEQDRLNRPRLWRDGEPLAWSLSISHADHGVLVALAPYDGVTVGVDLSDRTKFSPRIADVWFTPAEQDWYREADSPQIGAYLWAAKEAIYKATSAGESFAPRDIEIRPDGKCRYRNVPLADCQLQSWTIDGHLAVLAIVRSSICATSITTTIHRR